MTTAKKPKISSPFRLPDPPQRDPEDMTSAKHLAETGNMHHLKLHLGNPDTTIVKSELCLALDCRGSGAEFRVPDLLIAFGADPELYDRNNGYVVSEQDKPPDFVLEVASPSTRAEDNTGKRDFYARHGVAEYWRFDEEDRPGQAGRRPADRRCLRTRRHRGAGRRRPAGIQRGAEPVPALAAGRIGVDRPSDEAAHRHIRERTRRPNI